MDLFHFNLDSVLGTKNWHDTSADQKRNFIMIMLERFEVGVVRVYGRLNLLCPLFGGFFYCVHYLEVISIACVLCFRW